MNHYDSLARWNAAIFAATGVGLLFSCGPDRLGNAIIAGGCFLTAAILFIFSPQFADKSPFPAQPTWDDIRRGMAGFYKRMLS